MTMVLVLSAAVALPAADSDAKPLSAEEAGRHVGEKVVVELTIVATKDRLEKRKEIYLDSTDDHTNPRNLAIVVTVTGAASLKQSGVADPATHFKGKTVRVRGTVTLKEKEPRIEVDDADQLKIVEMKK
jgi:hypothetical protein